MSGFADFALSQGQSAAGGLVCISLPADPPKPDIEFESGVFGAAFIIATGTMIAANNSIVETNTARVTAERFLRRSRIARKRPSRFDARAIATPLYPANQPIESPAEISSTCSA